VNELVWIDERDALALHSLLLALYGGAPGVRDRGLLESALSVGTHQPGPFQTNRAVAKRCALRTDCNNADVLHKSACL
jgi:hypothetical protein